MNKKGQQPNVDIAVHVQLLGKLDFQGNRLMTFSKAAPTLNTQNPKYLHNFFKKILHPLSPWGESPYKFSEKFWISLFAFLWTLPKKFQQVLILRFLWSIFKTLSNYVHKTELPSNTKQKKWKNCKSVSLQVTIFNHSVKRAAIMVISEQYFVKSKIVLSESGSRF